jgi:hypothetical protein
MIEEFRMCGIVRKRVCLQILGNDAETFTRLSLRKTMYFLEIPVSLVTFLNRLTNQVVDLRKFFLSRFLRKGGRCSGNGTFALVLEIVISGQRQSCNVVRSGGN